jgi:GT2 family glycosyltransferase
VNDGAGFDDTGLDVVVVAYGPPASLAQTLASLGDDYPVVVVDNASSPATAELVRAAGARYLDPGRNLGFAAAVNLALRELVDPDRDVLLLNPDARIDAGQLALLHDQLRARAELACVAPAQYVPGSGTPSRARWPWHSPAGAWADAVGLAGRRVRSSRYFLGGAVLLVRKAALADVGGLDERFFLYSEDEDWQRRALARGWQVRFCPEVSADHASGGTETDATRHLLRLHAAIERYIRKWHGSAGWALFRAGTLFGLSLRLISHRGSQRTTTARLAQLYLSGPDRTARRSGAVPDT